MIRSHDSIPMILAEFPEFGRKLEEHLRYWGMTEAGLCNQMAVFQRYVEDLLQVFPLETEDVQRAFNLVERMMTEGDRELQDAVATCFLENFLNRGRIKPTALSPYLGTESRKYCKAWDAFTGVDSGL